MALVSSIYRMAPPVVWVSLDDPTGPLRGKVHRLIAIYGREEVLRRIREYPVSSTDDTLKERLLAAVNASTNATLLPRSMPQVSRRLVVV